MIVKTQFQQLQHEELHLKILKLITEVMLNFLVQTLATEDLMAELYQLDHQLMLELELLFPSDKHAVVLIEFVRQ